ncbi:hypothetical protein LC613_39485 [Nostoc sphaeroides CHAB 2801]|uniref:hypothetical protein n=1 Tax=Nostoc sphaeroides TaxID=446679 RepID=UPI001E43D2FC|nr:hypothetical protein [Nostoc sphaeroides]MCC5633543.1 hypothetical protein [Nostoc sphaeroides CHAB 2801]
MKLLWANRLQWKKNDRQLGRRNGQEFTVIGIDLNIVQIKYADERTECISLATTLDKLTTALIQSEQREISQLAINAIVDYVEQSSVESALAETLPTVIKELSFYAANSEFTKIVTNVVAVIDNLSECLKQKTAGVVEEKEEVTTNILLLIKKMLQHLDKQQMSDLFIEVGKYAQGEKVKGDQVNELFSRIGQADLPLTFEQRMNLVRQLIREDKARIMSLLSIPQSHESKQSRFRR